MYIKHPLFSALATPKSSCQISEKICHSHKPISREGKINVEREREVNEALTRKLTEPENSMASR